MPIFKVLIILYAMIVSQQGLADVLDFLSPSSSISNLSSQEKNLAQAIWTIKANNYVGTAFFISSTKILTNFHVLVPLLSKKEVFALTDIEFQRHASFAKDFKPKIIKVLALSASLDLALIEVDKASGLHLSLSKQAALSKNKPVTIMGYPHKKFVKITALDDIQISEIGESYFRHRHIFSLSGASGSPVLDNQLQVVGVFYGSDKMRWSINESEAYFVSLNDVRNFLQGQTGTSCLQYSKVNKCINASLNELYDHQNPHNARAVSKLIMFQKHKVIEDFKRLSSLKKNF